MRRTLREWEKLWRARWDMDDHVGLDHIFDLTDDVAETVCEVRLSISTQRGRIESVRIALFAEGDGTVLVDYEYTTLESDLVGLVQAVVASIDEEAPSEGDQDSEEHRLG